MADRSEEARLRAEANFKKKQQRTEDGESGESILPPEKPPTRTG
jgi:hypothetical protein